MWDNPRVLHAIAKALFVGAGTLSLWVGAQYALRSAPLPVRTVVLVGEVSHLDADRVSEQLAGHVTGNFLNVDVEDVRRRIEREPWVRRAIVRREWPDRLAVQVEEHHALARWSDGQLVNTYGELFQGAPDTALPQLGGPAGSEREVARRYIAFREIVAGLGTEPSEVLLSARRAWQIKLANGLVLALGRDDGRDAPETRLARFVAAYPRAIAQFNHRVDHIDLRYPNGFALRVPDQPSREVSTPRKRT